MPDSLFLNHYSLAETYGGTPSGWRKFLRDHEVFIAQEIAAITEANARLALNDLGSGKRIEITNRNRYQGLIGTFGTINQEQQ